MYFVIQDPVRVDNRTDSDSSSKQRAAFYHPNTSSDNFPKIPLSAVAPPSDFPSAALRGTGELQSVPRAAETYEEECGVLNAEEDGA